MRISKRWSDVERRLLKINYNESYEKLQEIFSGRTKRALKHEIGELGLRRDERARWTEDELKIIKDNVNLSPKELHELLPKRSLFKISSQAKAVRGTANRRFKEGWDKPSQDLAYFLGALCSDGHIRKYAFVIDQKIENKMFLDEVNKVVGNVFGLFGKFSIERRKWIWNGVEKEKDYVELRICSDQFSNNLGFCGDKGEWGDVLKEKFLWIFDDDYFWSFIGGLYDGDGSINGKIMEKEGKMVVYNVISIAIKPKRTRGLIKSEMVKRGFDVGETEHVIRLRGGSSEIDRFLNSVKCVIPYKKTREIEVI